jgi:hypothetical protein
MQLVNELRGVWAVFDLGCTTIGSILIKLERSSAPPLREV